MHLSYNRPYVGHYRTLNEPLIDLDPPFVPAAVHDADNEGLLPVSALSNPVKLEFKVWDAVNLTDVYQVLWDEKLVGEEKAITDSDFPGSPLFLEIPTDLLTEGIHSLAYAVKNTENNIVEYSAPVRIEVDLTPPGRPQLGPIKFPVEIEGGLTSEELALLGDRLDVEIGGYTGMAKHDVIRTYWGDIEGPSASVTADDMGLNRVIITYARAFLESLGRFNGVVSYTVTDRAGNTSARSLGIFVHLLLETVPKDYPAPIIDPTLGELIDYAEAKAGVRVDIPRYPDAAPLDLVSLHWENENSPPIPVTEGNEDNDVVLSILVPYETIATSPQGVVKITYDVQRSGERVGYSLESNISVNIVLPGPEEIEAPTIQGTSTTNPNIENNFIDEDDYELNARAIIKWDKGFEISDDLALYWGQEFIPQWYQIKASDVTNQKDLTIPIPNNVLKAQGTGAQIPVRFALTRFDNPNIAHSKMQSVIVRSKDETPGGINGLNGPSFNTTEQGVVGPIENPNGADVFIAPYVNILKDQIISFTFTAFDNNNNPIEEANFQEQRELDSADTINGYTFKIPASKLKRICIGYGEACFKVIPPAESNQSPATSRITRVRINMSKPSTGCGWIA